MKNNEILNCYQVLSNIANRSDVHERFKLALKCQELKPHHDAIESTRIGLVQKYANKDGSKVEEKNIPQFQKEYEELLNIDVKVAPFILLGEVQTASMEELLVLKDVIIDGN